VEQEAAFLNKKSKAHFGQSPHNHSPSFAVDVVPYIEGSGIPWDDADIFDELIDHIMDCADRLYEHGKLTGRVESAFLSWGWDRPHWQCADWKEKLEDY
jgi:hypothetical protein